MSYDKFYTNGWQSGEAGGTPITPEALNHIEQGIAQAYSDLAPAGFGLGTTSVNIDTVYDITKNGLYLTNGDTPDGSWWFANAVVTNGGASIIVDAWKLNGTMRSLIVKNNGAWGDWISWQDFLTNGGTKNGNFDELVDVGIYWMQTAYCTSSPYGEDDTGHYGFLLVSKAAPGSVLQIFVEYSTSATYVRNNVNGWKSWVRTDAGIAADHIVARGASGIWNYRKWSSGVAECWANYTFAPGAFESAGTSSCFYYAVSDAIAFPFTFVELKSVQANVNSWRYVNWASSATVNKDNAGICRVMLFQTHNQIHSDGYEIAIHAVGTWK